MLIAAFTLGGSAVTRADIPAFNFDASQVGRSIELYPKVFSAEFYPPPPCEFEIYRRAGDSEPWDKLYIGDLGDHAVTCEPLCYVDEWGEEYCYPPETKSVCTCETFVDLCPEPGEYEYQLIIRDVVGPWGTGDWDDLFYSREVSVEPVEGECVAPSGTVTGTWWPREHHDGCDTTNNPGLPHLLVLMLFVTGVGLSSVLRRASRKQRSIDK